ncbi:MAG: D-2-hydroxyacid dehydrogenase family protein [Gammaproteobacteria bacterium]
MKIAVLDDYQHAALRMADWSIVTRDCGIQVFDDHLHDEDALVARLAGFGIVAAMRERTAFPRRVLERLPDLRLIATTGMVNAAIDLAAAADLGITVCGTGGKAEPTAELTWALILALLRDVQGADAAIRAGGWQTGIGIDLNGRTLGIVGLGRLGAQVAAVGRAFRMRVLAWSPNLTPERAAAGGAEWADRERLFGESDIVSVHMVLSTRTRGLIGAADFGRMRPDAFFINTSRGPLVDEAALIDAVRSRRIAGAGLDVFDLEPLPADHPLRSLPNAILTPHIGYVTGDTYRVFFEETVQNIRAFLDGAPVRVMKPRRR